MFSEPPIKMLLAPFLLQDELAATQASETTSSAACPRLHNAATSAGAGAGSEACDAAPEEGEDLEST